MTEFLFRTITIQIQLKFKVLVYNWQELSLYSDFKTKSTCSVNAGPLKAHRVPKR